MPRLMNIAFLFSLATLSASALAQNANQARPGTLNYTEGQVSIQGQPVATGANADLGVHAGEVLSTANGKAEILLTPGIFLRLGNNSAVQMVSPDLTHTEVRIQQGEANVEVDQIFPQNRILIDLNNGQTQLLKTGLYNFNAATGAVRVFDGKAAAFPGQAEKPIDIKGDHQFVFNGDQAKPQKFDKDSSQDDLYKWSSLRSQYLGQANLNLASQYAGSEGSFYPGWYWAGGPYGYTWLPGDGLFWNPFGFGFYGPGYLYGGGLIYGRYGAGYGYPWRGGYGYRGGVYANRGGAVAYRGSAPAHGYSGGGYSGGGFHGGGGGFHGGGGGHR